MAILNDDVLKRGSSNNTTLSTWKSTIIVRKEGSAPKSPTDGVVILTNTSRDKYKSTDLLC